MSASLIATLCGNDDRHQSHERARARDTSLVYSSVALLPPPPPSSNNTMRECDRSHERARTRHPVRIFLGGRTHLCVHVTCNYIARRYEGNDRNQSHERDTPLVYITRRSHAPLPSQPPRSSRKDRLSSRAARGCSERLQQKAIPLTNL